MCHPKAPQKRFKCVFDIQSIHVCIKRYFISLTVKLAHAGHCHTLATPNLNMYIGWKVWRTAFEAITLTIPLY